jgi:hypothetical protein
MLLQEVGVYDWRKSMNMKWYVCVRYTVYIKCHGVALDHQTLKGTVSRDEYFLLSKHLNQYTCCVCADGF